MGSLQSAGGIEFIPKESRTSSGKKQKILVPAVMSAAALAGVRLLPV